MISLDVGIGDFGVEIIDYPNGTYQGAVLGLARLCAADFFGAK